MLQPQCYFRAGRFCVSGRVTYGTSGILSLAIALRRAFRPLGPASAATATLSVDPNSTTIDQNQDLTLKVKLNADVDTSAAQTDIEFNAELLQVQDVVAGALLPGRFLPRRRGSTDKGGRHRLGQRDRTAGERRRTCSQGVQQLRR